jgi:hypothetical protein
VSETRQNSKLAEKLTVHGVYRGRLVQRQRVIAWPDEVEKASAVASLATELRYSRLREAEVTISIDGRVTASTQLRGLPYKKV